MLRLDGSILIAECDSCISERSDKPLGPRLFDEIGVGSFARCGVVSSKLLASDSGCKVHLGRLNHQFEPTLLGLLLGVTRQASAQNLQTGPRANALIADAICHFLCEFPFSRSRTQLGDAHHEPGQLAFFRLLKQNRSGAFQ